MALLPLLIQALAIHAVHEAGFLTDHKSDLWLRYQIVGGVLSFVNITGCVALLCGGAAAEHICRIIFSTRSCKEKPEDKIKFLDTLF